MPDLANFATGRIAMQLQSIASKSLVHPQANYVVAKVLDFGDAGDCLIITKPIFDEPYRVLGFDVKNSKFAIIKVVRAVDKLVSLPNPQPLTNMSYETYTTCKARFIL